MLTQDRIERVRRQTSSSVARGARAVLLTDDDVDRAIDELTDPALAGNRPIIAGDFGHAQRLAAALLRYGIWFECDAMMSGKWRFTVALGAYARVRALDMTLRCAA